MSNPAVAVLRLLAFVVWTLAALGPYLLLMACGWKGYAAYASAYWRVVARLCGIRLRVRGRALERGPVLYVANHASYLDIIVLGSVLRACFVAKSEVAGWPGFGFMARVAQTVFVDRKRRGAHRERDAIRRRLDGGDSLILFPEGTSNDGNRVLPFKSSLFAVAAEPLDDGAEGKRALPVQAISVAYTRLDGAPMGRALRPFYAWYGDMTMAGHLFTALGLGQVEVEVIFHPPVTLAHFPDRKALCNHCHDLVRRGVVLALAGRLPPEDEEGMVPLPHPVPTPAAVSLEASGSADS